MGSNPHTNGGLLLRDLNMPDFRKYAVPVPYPGSAHAADTNVLGGFLRDVISLMSLSGTSVFSVPTKLYQTG